MAARPILACVALIMVALADSGFGQTQLEMNEQAGSELRKAQARLDAVYAGLMGKISSAGKASLQATQETWLRFRDQECDFETMGTVGGSVHPMVVAECRRGLTNQRTKDLEDQLNCQEGNLSCGGQ